jgi:hypothetical protein
MGDWNIGLAMVAARLATSETGREQEAPKGRVWHALDHRRGGGQENRRRSLPGVMMEVVKGRLFLIPSVDATEQEKPGGRTPTRNDGSTARIETGEDLPPPGTR